ncbi:hypothetical protein C8R43DRAFT_1135713 [Mycena crocata]|nr:hypothetical protein C8R43DRAFT_1135713 [Mycena crocata]
MKGKAFLYTRLNAITSRIPMETPVPGRRNGNILAANVGLAHIARRIVKLPYLRVEEVFTVPNAIIHDAVVCVGNDQFLVSGFYSPIGPINGALKTICPGFDWRGELSVVALGLQVAYLPRIKPALLVKAVNKEEKLDSEKRLNGNFLSKDKVQQGEIKHLNQQIKKSEDRLAELTGNEVKLKRDLEEARQRGKELAETNKDLEQTAETAEELNADIKRYQKDLEQAESKITYFQEQASRWRLSTEAFERSVPEINTEDKEEWQDLGTELARATVLEKKVADLTETMNQLTQQSEQQILQVQDSEEALKSAEARMTEMSGTMKREADESKSRLTELGNDKVEFNLQHLTELEAAAKKIQDSEAALKSAEIKLESGLLEKTAELEAAAKRIQDSEAALKSAEIKLESGLLEKTAELEAAAKRIQDSEAALQSAEVRIAEISERTKSEADQSKSRLTELGNDKTRLESELLNKTAELEAAVKKIQDSEAALKSAETKLDSELLETSAELEAAVKQAQDAEAALKSAEIRIAEILEAVESKEARIEILQSEKTRLESEILSQKSELQAVTIKSQKFEEAVKAKEEHIQILGQEASDDKLEADWLQESIDAKTEKLHMARKKNYQLLELLNTHERRIWDLEQQISRDAVTAEEREFMISELQETASELQTQQVAQKSL